MVEFNELSLNDQKIITELLRKRCAVMLAEINDLDGLSERGMDYYKHILNESLSDDINNED